MDTTRPATLTPNMDTEAGRRKARDLTFLLAPPADREGVEEITRAAAGVGVTPEELWIEMVRGSVNELLEPEGYGRSLLDEVVSRVLGVPVTVWGVQGALHFQSGRRIPGLTIITSQVLDAAGQPVDCDFADMQIRARIGRALMDYTHADNVICTAWYVPDEPGVPCLASATGRKEA